MSNPKPHEPGDVLRCSFCNKSQRDVKKLIAGPTVYICDECIGICVDILAEDGISTEELYNGPLPDQLVLAADKVTPGHHDAKRILAAALTQHAIRVHENETQRAISAVFVCGATGAGKSQLVRGMTQALGLPLGAIDVPLLFADSPFKPKLEFAGFDQKAGVIVLNQIEAVAMRGSKAEECRRVQQALISIIDGAWLQLTAESTRTTHKSTAFDTGRALFIALGSFPEMNSDECIGPEALVRHGYLPELIARFGSFVTLQPLNEQEMTELLIRDDGLVAECTKRFAKYDVRVAFDPPALTEIVRLGARRKAGVRGLKALMDRLGIALACEQTTAGRELHVDAAFVTRNLS